MNSGEWCSYGNYKNEQHTMGGHSDFVAFALGRLGFDWPEFLRSDTSPLGTSFGVGDPGKAKKVLGWSLSIRPLEVISGLASTEYREAVL